MITTDKFTIRTIEESDIDVIHKWNTSEFRGMFQEFEFQSKQSLIKQFDNDGFCSETFQMLIVESKDAPIGLIYLNFIRPGLADIGLVLCDNSRNNGLGTLLTSTVIDHLFANYNIVRIQADTDAHNISAQKVLEKAGFKREGILNKYRYHHGKFNDAVLYAITR